MSIVRGVTDNTSTLKKIRVISRAVSKDSLVSLINYNRLLNQLESIKPDYALDLEAKEYAEELALRGFKLGDVDRSLFSAVHSIKNPTTKSLFPILRKFGTRVISLPLYESDEYLALIFSNECNSFGFYECRDNHGGSFSVQILGFAPSAETVSFTPSTPHVQPQYA